MEKGDPQLVVHDENHQIYTVRYEAVNAMLLNEVQKEHQEVEERKARLDAQQKRLDNLKAKFVAFEARIHGQILKSDPIAHQ